MDDVRGCSVLIVDDTKVSVDVLVEALHDECEVSVALDGETALGLVEREPPDLVLLDVMMPGMDGYEVCRRLKSREGTASIPVMFLTAMGDARDKSVGFELGAVDYVTKPFEVPEVKARVRTHLALVRARRALENQNARLERAVTERTRELEATRDATVGCLSELLEHRDPETGGHIRRTRKYVRLLAEGLREHERFRIFLAGDAPELLEKASSLHDVGKVGVPDSILLKPGKLTPEEYEIMKRHTTIGWTALKRAERPLGGNTFLRSAGEIAYTHHERWDGLGYPRGLAGEEIPASGRIMAIADVYDALTSRRVYAPALEHDEAVGVMVEERGGQFDPAALDVFVERAEWLRAAGLALRDNVEDEAAWQG